MSNIARKYIQRLLSAFATATAEDCQKKGGKCFGIDWSKASPEEVAKVDVNARDKRGLTPLHVAVMYGAIREMELLIQNGADVNAKDNSGNTPLHMAALCEDANKADLLIKKKAKANIKNKLGQTPLHNAAKCQRDVVVQLTEKGGADVAIEDNSGLTPLHIAAMETKDGNVTLLIQKGSKTDAKDSNGRTPMHLAALKNDKHSPEVINTLFRLSRNKVEINAKDKDGNTPLHLAVSSYAVSSYTSHGTSTVPALISLQANVSIKNERGETALDLGKENKDFFESQFYKSLNDATWKQKSQ